MDDLEFVVVELENGDQTFFDSVYDGFLYAKDEENKQRNSVAYLAVGTFWNEDDVARVYRGQQLRYLLRLIDNINGWIKA